MHKDGAVVGVAGLVTSGGLRSDVQIRSLPGWRDKFGFRVITDCVIAGFTVLTICSIAVPDVQAQVAPQGGLSTITQPSAPGPDAPQLLLDLSGSIATRDVRVPIPDLNVLRDHAEQRLKREGEVRSDLVPAAKPTLPDKPTDAEADKKAAEQKPAAKSGAVASSASASSSSASTAGTTLFDLGTNDAGKTRDDAPGKSISPPFNGSFTHQVRIDVPGFRGLEPSLTLV